jgi:hypothetical protein
MEIRWFALGCGLVFLAGCSSGWVKPGASQQEFGEDRSTCLKEAERPGGSVFINPFTGMFGHETYTDSRLYNACMVDHGWSKSSG